MFLQGKPDVDKVSFSVTDENGITTGVEISTGLIIEYMNGFRPEKEYASVEIDEYGFFIIDGKKLERHNSTTSRTGSLLKVLFLHKGELVTNDDLKKAMSVSNKDSLDKAFKDLKSKLPKDGYQLDCFRVRSQGIVLKGIIKQQ